MPATKQGEHYMLALLMTGNDPVLAAGWLEVERLRSLQDVGTTYEIVSRTGERIENPARCIGAAAIRYDRRINVEYITRRPNDLPVRTPVTNRSRTVQFGFRFTDSIVNWFFRRSVDPVDVVEERPIPPIDLNIELGNPVRETPSTLECVQHSEQFAIVLREISRRRVDRQIEARELMFIQDIDIIALG